MKKDSKQLFAHSSSIDKKTGMVTDYFECDGETYYHETNMTIDELIANYEWLRGDVERLRRSE